MNTDDAILAVVDAATSILLGAQPVCGMKGMSTIQDSRIKRLANAVKDLRNELGLNHPGVPITDE